MYSKTRFGCDVADAFTPAAPASALSSFHSQAQRNQAIQQTWDQGGVGSAYAVAAKTRRETRRQAPTRVVPQGPAVNTEQVFDNTRIGNMGGAESLAGHVPVQGTSLPQAQLGVPFTQRTPAPGVPFNPLAVNAGRGSAMYAAKAPNNGLPYEWQGTLGLIGDYAGTVTDPYSGQVYAAYTDVMQEPKVLDEVPVIKLGEPSRMLEAMTGTLSFPKPIPQEHLVDWGDVAEGVRFPQGLVDGVVENRIARDAAGQAYLVNNESLAGYDDTAWDGYIGDTYVLRPAIDTQTLQDNSQTNTVDAGRIQAPQVNAAFQLGEGVGAHMGMVFQPIINLLAEEKPSGPGRPKRDFAVNGYWSLPAVNTAGYSHRILDTVNSRADPLFSLNLGGAFATTTDGDPVDRTQVMKTGQALHAAGPPSVFAMSTDANSVSDAGLYSAAAARVNAGVSVYGALPGAASDNSQGDDRVGAVYAAGTYNGAPLRAAHTLQAASTGSARDAGVQTTGAAANLASGNAPNGQWAMVANGPGHDAGVQTVRAAANLASGQAPNSQWAMVANGAGHDADVQTVRAAANLASGNAPNSQWAMVATGDARDDGHVTAQNPNGFAAFGRQAAMAHAADGTGLRDAGAGFAVRARSSGVATASAPTVGGGNSRDATVSQHGAGVPSSTAGTVPVTRLPTADDGNGGDNAGATHAYAGVSGAGYAGTSTNLQPAYTAVGKNGLNSVISMLAGAGVDGTVGALGVATVNGVGSGRVRDGVVSTAPAAAVTTAGESAHSTLPMLSTADRGHDGRLLKTAQALDLGGAGVRASMPSGRDGTLAWDALLRKLSVAGEYDLHTAPMPFMTDNAVGARALSVPLRVSNDATLFATGQSMGDQNLPTLFSDGGTHKEASDFGAQRQAREQLAFERNARAHPSTHGTGAVFRNVYEGMPCDRSGMVSLNPDTARLMSSPARLIMEAAADAQLWRRDLANANKDASMYTTREAYESDFGNSDVE